MSSTPLQNCSSVLHPCHATTTILTQSLKLLALLPSHGSWALLKKITTVLMLSKSHSCLQPQRGPRTASQSFFFFFPFANYFVLFLGDFSQLASLQSPLFNSQPSCPQQTTSLLNKKTIFQASDTISHLLSPVHLPLYRQIWPQLLPFFPSRNFNDYAYDTECHSVTPALTHPQSFRSISNCLLELSTMMPHKKLKVINRKWTYYCPSQIYSSVPILLC